MHPSSCSVHWLDSCFVVTVLLCIFWHIVRALVSFHARHRMALIDNNKCTTYTHKHSLIRPRDKLRVCDEANQLIFVSFHFHCSSHTRTHVKEYVVERVEYKSRLCDIYRRRDGMCLAHIHRESEAECGSEAQCLVCVARVHLCRLIFHFRRIKFNVYNYIRNNSTDESKMVCRLAPMVRML